MALTVSGNGFMTDQLTAKGRCFKKMVFNESMTRSMGLEKLAKAAGGDNMVEVMSHLDIKAYVAASNSWLWYNESAKMARLEAPLLWIWPAGDGAFGAFMTLKAIEKEMRLAPEDLPKEVKVFNKTGKEGHGYYAEDPDAYFGAVAEWVRKFPKGRPLAHGRS